MMTISSQGSPQAFIFSCLGYNCCLVSQCMCAAVWLLFVFFGLLIVNKDSYGVFTFLHLLR